MKRIGLLALGAALVLSLGVAQDSTSTDTSTAATDTGSMGMIDFASFDTDGSGDLSSEEFSSGLFASFDTDGSGSISHAEYEAGLAMWSGSSALLAATPVRTQQVPTPVRIPAPIQPEPTPARIRARTQQVQIPAATPVQTQQALIRALIRRILLQQVQTQPAWA
jgi:hypothetical protein